MILPPFALVSCSPFQCCGHAHSSDETSQITQLLMQAIQRKQSSVGSSESEPESQPEPEEHKQSARSKVARLPPCIHCDQDAISFCASCGGDLCAEHDSEAHSAADRSSASHVRMLQANKSDFLKAMVGGSSSAFSKSVEARKAEVQEAARALAAVEASLKLQTKGRQGQSHRRKAELQAEQESAPIWTQFLCFVFAVFSLARRLDLRLGCSGRDADLRGYSPTAGSGATRGKSHSSCTACIVARCAVSLL